MPTWISKVFLKLKRQRKCPKTHLRFCYFRVSSMRRTANHQITKVGFFENVPFSQDTASLIERLFRSKILKKYFLFLRSLSPAFTPYDSAHERTQPTPALSRRRSRSLGLQDKELGEFFPVLNRPPNGALELPSSNVSKGEKAVLKIS